MIRILPLTKETVSEAAKIEKLCLETAWGESELMKLTDSSHAVYFLAYSEDKPCGTAGMYIVCDDAQITNICVVPEKRCAGIGTALLCALMDAAGQRGARVISLEVSCENIPAIAMYKRKGFREAGHRKGFYSGKDAVVMIYEY